MKVWPVLLTLALVVLCGCADEVTSPTPSSSPSASSPTAESLASQYGLHTWPASQTMPESLDGIPWALYQSACQDIGFDLRPYRGQEVLFTLHGLRESHGGVPATLVTMTVGEKLIGAFVTVGGEVPGVYSLKEAGSWR